MPLDIPVQSWRRDAYLVSTDLALVQVNEVNRVFESDLMWWAQGLPGDVMVKTMENSLCFGLYQVCDGGSEGRGAKVDGGKVETGKYRLAFSMVGDRSCPDP